MEARLPPSPPSSPPSPAGPTVLARAVRTVWIGLLAAWVVFSAWLFVYAMPLSGLHALVGAWAVWPSRAGAPGRARPHRARRLAAVGIVAAALLTVPLVGLPEYAATTNALHCRALGFTGAPAPADCDAAELARGATVAKEGGPLFSTRERLGVHGFNLLLALGGGLVGLPEVAGETAALSFTADPLPPGAGTAVRRAQCRASYGDAASAHAVLGPPRTVRSDFPMRSARVRRAIADGAARLGSSSASLELGEIHFVHGLDNVDAYTGALVTDSVRVALALEVADGRLALTRRPDGAVDVAWTGTIHYPGEDIAFVVPLPLPWGPPVLRVSETVFCGMHADGAMNPYRLTYAWTLAPDDPRLGPERDQPQRGLGERIALALVARFGVVLAGG
ncbi:MAG: hypothetical protein Q8P41_02030 [Pseudomonadota bacterium]|nr:hypothetical protein [Pseudomonadota bacterium]